MRQNSAHKLKVAVLENGLISTYTAREGLMKALINEGFEVYVLTQINSHVDKANELGVNVAEIGSASYNPLKIGRYLYRLRNELKKIKPDICLTFSIRPAIFGNLVAKSLNIPVITNITGTGPLFDDPNLAYIIISKLYPIALKRTKCVFFQNVSDRDSFIKSNFIKEEQADVIPGSGIDYKKFYPQDKAKEYLNEFSFLYIGRLLRDKGVPEFVEAARIFKKKYPKVKFRIIGPEWHQNTKKNQISRETLDQWVKEDVIEYLGEKTDVRQYIANCDSVVLPSHREGTSNVLLEGSSMERPCIATNVIGCKEIIDDGTTGYLCNLKDPEDLAKKMEKMFLLSKEERTVMGKAARRKVIAEYDKQIVINKYLESIFSVLKIQKTKTPVVYREPVEMTK